MDKMKTDQEIKVQVTVVGLLEKSHYQSLMMKYLFKYPLKTA